MSWYIINNGWKARGAGGLADAFAGESAYDFQVKQYDVERDLSEFRDQVTVILNIASE